MRETCPAVGLVLLVAALAALASALVTPARPAGAQPARAPSSQSAGGQVPRQVEPAQPPATEPIPPPAAFVVVDADRGVLMLGQNEHVRRPPASISKLMTALIATEHLDDDSAVTVSAEAAAMPARKLDIRQGQIWKERDLLQAMLLCSCNDVARALAENAGGSVGGFGTLARAEAQRLGVVDSPVLQDPAGLDDELSVGGGNRVSAFDMAIIARAFLADHELAAAVRVPSFRFTGPDGVIHEVVNHNRLLGSYPGAIGVKTGYTKSAGATLVAAATRGGRTILVVILGSADIWYHAPQLLDYGFSAPVTDAMQRLPALPGALAEPGPPAVPTSTLLGSGAVAAAPSDPALSAATPPATIATGSTSLAASRSSGNGWVWVVSLTIAVLLLVVGLTALRRRFAARSRAAARDRAKARDAALELLVGD